MKSNTFKTLNYLAATLIFAAFAGADAVAAEQTGEGRYAGENVLEEVIVTAMRREELVTNVPISISAFNQTLLDQKGIKDIANVSRITPGLTFTPGWIAAAGISIRGISSSIGAATTGIYIDDTPIQIRRIGAGGLGTNTYPTVFDLDRIEVIRGPQGTLFGAGSEGGTVRFIMPEPSLNSFSKYGRSEVGFTDGGGTSYEIGGAMGGPFVEDKIGFRVSAFVREDGGWIDRVHYPSLVSIDDNSNSSNTVTLRAAVTFRLTDPDITITPSLFYQDFDRDDLYWYWNNISDPGDNKYLSGFPLAQESSDKFYLPSLKIEWNLHNVELFSNTSYFDRTNPGLADYTVFITEIFSGDFFVPAVPDFTSPTPYRFKQKVFTQEVRLQSSDPEARLRWVLGAFYQDSKQDMEQRVFAPLMDDMLIALYGATTEQLFGIPLGPDGFFYSGFDSNEDEQVAAFGSIDFDVTDNLTLTAGLRLAKVDFSFDNSQDGALNGGPTASNGKDSEKPVTPKFGVEYRPNDTSLLYARAAKGFRMGGANPEVPLGPCSADLASIGISGAPDSYDSDTVWSYEVGSKNRLFDNRLQIEASAFYIKWDDIQSVVYLPSCGFSFIRNVGTAVSQGFEFLSSFIPYRGLTLSTSVAYTNAKYKDTVYGPARPDGSRPIFVEDGDRLRVAPWHISVSGEYVFMPFGNDNQMYVRADYDYDKGYHIGPSTAAVSYDPVKADVNPRKFASARIGLRRSNWDASVFVDNLANYHDFQSTIHDTGSSTLLQHQGYRPRVIGITVTYRD